MAASYTHRAGVFTDRRPRDYLQGGCEENGENTLDVIDLKQNVYSLRFSQRFINDSSMFHQLTVKAEIVVADIQLRKWSQKAGSAPGFWQMLYFSTFLIQQGSV